MASCSMGTLAPLSSTFPSRTGSFHSRTGGYKLPAPPWASNPMGTMTDRDTAKALVLMVGLSICMTAWWLVFLVIMALLA